MCVNRQSRGCCESDPRLAYLIACAGGALKSFRRDAGSRDFESLR